MKLTNKLTSTTIRGLVLPPDKDEDVFWDGELPSFGLRVRRGGTRTWVVKYEIADRTRRLQFGSLAQLDASRARAVAKDLLAQVRLGRDPAREKTTARAKAAETFGALLPRFLERQRARLKPRSYEETERHLLAHAKPLHGHPIETIERRTVATRLAEIEKRSGPAASNRVRTSLSAFFTWAAREGYVDANPVSFTNKAVESGGRDRVLNDNELATVWRALVDDQYGAIVRLLMLTGARRDEIASLRWSEIDLDAATITLPPERTKNRREHVIPLSQPALAIVAAQPHRTEVDGRERDHVFGNGAARGFQDWSGSKADLDVRIAAARKGKALGWTLHDFRRSLSTALHDRFGVLPHVVETILGHADGHKAGVAGVYNKAIYLDERRRALQKWAAHIEQLITGGKPDRIVALR